MEYKVLYRKYRPSNFENIVGQEYITTILKNSIINKKVSHAYIFSGPRGTGKTTTAKVFAKTLNCLNPKENGPCEECEMCKSFQQNTDVIELDAASNNGVDEIRQIIDNVKISPTYSKYKVYIIDEVHMLTTSAFNALLLTLEEPPQNVVFILATTNIENVPVTILSRCQRFDFKKISNEVIAQRLKYVCEQEKIDADYKALMEISNLSDGGMRDALSILDQIRQENSNITLDVVEKIYGIVPTKIIEEIINNCYESNLDLLISNIENLRKLSINYKSLVKNTIMILKNKAIQFTKDGESDLFYKTKQLIVELNKSLLSLNVYIDPYVFFELSFLNIMNEPKQEGINSKVKVIDNTEKNEITVADSKQEYFPGNNSKQNDSVENIRKNVDVRVNNCFAEADKNILNCIKTSWNSLLSTITDNIVLSFLVDSECVAASDKYLIIQNNNESTCKLINNDSILVENELQKFYNHEYKVCFLTKEEWQKYKNNYIVDLKKGIKYELVEEIVKEASDSSNLESVASEVFDNKKIIID